jgi:hypothetical protein
MAMSMLIGIVKCAHGDAPPKVVKLEDTQYRQPKAGDEMSVLGSFQHDEDEYSITIDISQIKPSDDGDSVDLLMITAGSKNAVIQELTMSCLRHETAVVESTVVNEDDTVALHKAYKPLKWVKNNIAGEEGVLVVIERSVCLISKDATTL